LKHSTVPDWNQFREATFIRFQNQLQRVFSIFGWVPLRMALSRTLVAQILSKVLQFFPGNMGMERGAGFDRIINL
jgi:hypothetical protein